MILGILSDTHGRHDRAAAALDLLLANGAQAIIHCGDICGDRVLDELAAAAARLAQAVKPDSGQPAKPKSGQAASPDTLQSTKPGRKKKSGAIQPAAGVWFVWGNCDSSDEQTLRYARSLGLTPPQSVPLVLRFAGKTIAVFHGHEPELEVFDIAGVDYLLHGHTHERRDERIGTARVINPGALQRAAAYTVATLDLTTDRLKFWPI